MRGTAVRVGQKGPMKYADNSIQQDAHSCDATDSIDACSAKGNYLIRNACPKVHAPLITSQKVSQNLRQCSEYWRYWLSGHPDVDFVNTVLAFVVKGITILYKGPELDIRSKSWPSAIQFSQLVQDFIDTNVEQGKITGPLSAPPVRVLCLPPGGLQTSDIRKSQNHS